MLEQRAYKNYFISVSANGDSCFISCCWSSILSLLI